MTYDDCQPARYTVFYEDLSITTGHTYAEALDLFNRRAETKVLSIAPTTPYNTQS